MLEKDVFPTPEDKKELQRLLKTLKAQLDALESKKDSGKTKS